jgi:glyoxalase family protein
MTGSAEGLLPETAPAVMPGIHHVSAICSDPQRNVDFYTGLLGLRLVKRTVNYDDPGSYHLYYGDAAGTPGTLLTFFAWMLPPMVTGRARPGTGQITTTSFRIDTESVDFWTDRLAAAAVDFDGPVDRLGEDVIALRDPDGVSIELVARDHVAPRAAAWHDGPVPVQHAIRDLAGVTLCLAGYEQTAQLLEEMLGARLLAREGARFRFSAGAGHGAGGATIDLLCQPEGEPGRMGIGAVHHVAWRAPSADAQQAWRRVLAGAGLDVTPVLNRHYFESVYFREPGGVYFEVATDLPGFTVDEAADELGMRLQLPPWLEARRERIEAKLPALRD